MKTTKKLLTSILSAILISTISVQAFAIIPSYGEEYQNQTSKKYYQTFKDVNEKHWAFEYIAEMSERGVLAGYPNGNFYPDNNVTRAQFAKIMCLAAGLYVSPVAYTSYVDVPSYEWYAPYVEVGKNYLSGYISYGENYYFPESNALREDIAVALVKLKGYDTSIYDESILKTMFTDWQSISQGARKYVSVAVENGLISGYEDNTFRGQDTITRAEAATLLWRAYQYGNNNKVFEKEDLVEGSTATAPQPEYESKPTTNPNSVQTTIVEQSKENTEQEKKENAQKVAYSCNTVTKAALGNSFMMSTTDYDKNIYYYDKDDNTIYQIDMNTKKVSKLLSVKNLTYDDIKMVETEIVKQVPIKSEKNIAEEDSDDELDTEVAENTEETEKNNELNGEESTAEEEEDNFSEEALSEEAEEIEEEIEYETIVETVVEEKIIGTYKDFKVSQLYYNTGNNKLLMIGCFRTYSQDTSLQDRGVSKDAIYEIDGKKVNLYTDEINAGWLGYGVAGNLDDGSLIIPRREYNGCGYNYLCFIVNCKDFSETSIWPSANSDAKILVTTKNNKLYSAWGNGYSQVYQNLYSFSKDQWGEVTKTNANYMGFKDEYYYYWNSKDGKIAKSSLEGKISYIEGIDTKNNIEIKDYFKIPQKSEVSKMFISNNGSFLFYDEDAQAFRIIEKQ